MRAVLVLAAASTLAACQPAAFVRPEVAVPAQWPSAAVAAPGVQPAPPVSSAPGAPPAAPLDLATAAWSAVFPLPELQALVDEAFAANSDLRIAIERIELARAQYGIERAAQFPALNVAGSATRERMPGFDPRTNQIGESAVLALASPAWEIDLWGRLAARTEAARRDVLANAALAEGVRISLAAQVGTLYLELLDLDHQIAITQRTLEGRRKALRLTQARFDEGISSILDVRQAESLLAGSTQALAEQQRRLTLAENTLAALLGRNPGPITRSLRLDTLVWPQHVSAGLPSDLLIRRPDIRAAEEALRGAGANVEAARKAYLPSLSLTTLLGAASTDLAQLFDSGRFAWSVQPALALPLFDAGRRQAGVRLAEAQERILVEQYKATVRQAFREVHDALVSLVLLQQQRAAGAQVVAANRERLRITNARYLAGISSYFEVLDAERQLFDSELSLSQTTRASYQAVVQLYRALGGGWQGKLAGL